MMRNKIIGRRTMLLLCIFLLAGCTAKKSEKLVYTGTIESEEYDVLTEIGGQIAEVFAQEGQVIEGGQKLLQLEEDSLQAQLQQAQAGYESNLAKYEDVKQGARAEEINQAEANLEIAQAKLKELQSGSRAERIQQQEAVVQMAREKMQYAQQNYEYRKGLYEKYNAMQKEGSSTKQQLEDAKNLLDQAHMQLTSAKEEVKSTEAQLDLLQNGESQYTLDAARASVKQAQAQYDKVISGSTANNLKSLYALTLQAKANVDLMKINLQKASITSPIKGTLLETYIKKGEVVSQGAVVATVSDLNRLWVKIYVPEKYYDKLSLGQKVDLASDRIKEKIHGEITYISSEAEFTPKNTETKEARENTVFEIKIEIKDHLKQLRPGMSLEVQI